MFVQLMPLLKQRVVMITVSDIGGGSLRVNIIPGKLAGSSDENAALTTPLSVVGKPEELDRDLVSQLTSFTQSIIDTSSNLDELRTQHTAAIKALEAEQKKLDEKKKLNGSKAASAPATSSPGPEFKDGTPVFGSKTGPVAANTRILFDAGLDHPDDHVAEPSADEETTAPQPQHPSSAANSYPD